MSDREHHAELELEVVEKTIEALTAAIRLARLSDGRADLAVLAARKISELARAGERDVERLQAAAFEMLQH